MTTSIARRAPRAAVSAVAVLGLFTVSACATEDQATTTTEAATTSEAASESATSEPALSANVSDAEGTEFGTVNITEGDGALEFSAEFSGMEPGFYGFHIHGIGECEPDSAAPDDLEDTGDFMSAGGHLGADEADHPDHAGDLPQLLVQESGSAQLSFTTDRLTLADLEDEDGAAMMIHSGPDNYANVPERYAPEGPDADTTGAGDAGSRLACGVIG